VFGAYYAATPLVMAAMTQCRTHTDIRKNIPVQNMIIKKMEKTMSINIDPQLVNILVCPATKAPVQLNDDKNELVCTASRLAYPIRDGIPVMLENEARDLSDEEYEHYKG
jgi:uncharacterized protein